MSFDHRKYRRAPVINLADRQWPNRVLERAPLWCAVDLRDGNQALVEPMTVAQKLQMWALMTHIGFKHIEVGFPAASQPDFDFVRELIERNLIPDDVTIQVLVQAREDLIARTFEALKGAKRAIVHVYNSVNPTQRNYVFNSGKDGVKAIAVQGARWVREYAARNPGTEWSFQYSPESFSSTEVEFAVEVCDAVIDEWRAAARPMILNLPATVEVSTPNVFADQVEWFCRHLKARPEVSISIHTHNDRGCGVAAAELAVLAGADRIEGTLLGNGERTGNMDIVTMAMNLYSQGIDPELDLSDMDAIVATVGACTQIALHPRHPYAGELVYTAFSGSHQDAINKGMSAVELTESGLWEVPYLPIDPQDVGRTYESIIRINSQSGKGGVAYIMDHEFGFKLPKEMQPGFGRVIQEVTDAHGDELSPEMIFHTFEREYLHNPNGFHLKSFNVLKRHFDRDEEASQAEIEAVVVVRGEERTVHAVGNGPLDAFCAALREGLGLRFVLHAYHEHALTRGSGAKAVSYIEILDADEESWWGAGVDTDIIVASIKSLLSALNRSSGKRKKE